MSFEKLTFIVFSRDSPASEESSKIYHLKNYRILKNNIRLHFFLCLRWFGKINNKEKQTLKWIVPKELDNCNLLKSNESFKIFLNNFIFPTTH